MGAFGRFRRKILKASGRLFDIRKFILKSPNRRPGAFLGLSAVRRRLGDQPVKILLVEDQPLLREAVAQVLRSAGHEVLEAGSMIPAMALLRDTKGIRLVWSDGWMPIGIGTTHTQQGPQPLTGPYGLELLTYAKAHGIPGVFWSADYQALEHAKKLGFRTASKTTMPTEMLAIINEVGA